jgi:hypothetical protein
MDCARNNGDLDECLVHLRKQALREEDQERNPRTFRGCKGCSRSACQGPVPHYQNQQRIWGAARVPASLYQMNLAALSAYRPPMPVEQLVAQPGGAPYLVPAHTFWHQLSDRPRPSVQAVKTASGSAYRGSSTRRTIVRLRPGATSPGGEGVDIKHGSYERYLNKLKGRGPVRRGAPAAVAPREGDKRLKPGIVAGCGPWDCGGSARHSAAFFSLG